MKEKIKVFEHKNCCLTIISIIVVICQNSGSIGQHFLRYCTNYRHVGLKINQRWINLGSNMVILAEASMIMISGGGLRWNLFFTIDCLHKVFKSRADLFWKRQETDEYRGKYPQLSGQEKLPNSLPLTFICYGDFLFCVIMNYSSGTVCHCLAFDCCHSPPKSRTRTWNW